MCLAVFKDTGALPCSSFFSVYWFLGRSQNVFPVTKLWMTKLPLHEPSMLKRNTFKFYLSCAQPLISNFKSYWLTFHGALNKAVEYCMDVDFTYLFWRGSAVWITFWCLYDTNSKWINQKRKPWRGTHFKHFYGKPLTNRGDSTLPAGLYCCPDDSRILDFH